MASDQAREAIQHLNFLVAENNPALQRSIAKTLADSGVQKCAVVATGTQAWDAWKENPALAVVICSWNLPEIEGIEVVRRIRADRERQIQPAIIVMSADGSPEAEKAAREGGADGFLRKPFAAEDLIPSVLGGLEHHKQSAGISGSLHSLAAELLGHAIPVELVFDRYTTKAECEEVNREGCVIKVMQNYGLGTRLSLRFARGEGDAFYAPVKGVVTKIERVPKDIGSYRMHVKFAAHAKAGSGDASRGGAA
ncbi:MAG: response regulator [Candidatus Lambdaproteobacteria bacterium]|nr:response regulator [Candidatus Lambdaproteobacteria bacterium]